MRKNFTVWMLLLLVQFSYAQSFRVYFNDKEQNLENPKYALSEKAIEKRILRNIDLDHRDIAVSSNFLKSIKKNGGDIKMKSRWFNYALVEGLSESELLHLPFVKKVEVVEKYRLHLTNVEGISGTDEFVYGKSESQIKMVNGHKLHELGFLGDGLTIAVLDAGFNGVQTAVAFDSLRSNNRILGSYDFRAKDTNVFTGGNHGTYVLSILGGFIDSQLIGSAPHANYWLLKTEYGPTETPVEMDHWLEGAEFADSVGADIITTSLGYSTFDNPADSYTYSDMDGNTTVVTKAADIAASKGILVISSAGNEGAAAWQYITAPADGDSVMAVGAVGANRQRASFSSIGPSADGRIKPDVMAQGEGTAISNSSVVFLGNGTSFSCPVISGMAACLWQVNPSKSNMEIFEAIIRSSDRNWAPVNTYGYGIPNFEQAAYSIHLKEDLNNLSIEVFPNPVDEILYISIEKNISQATMELSIWDMSARELYNSTIELQKGKIELPFNYPSGVYFIKFNIGATSFTQKVLK